MTAKKKEPETVADQFIAFVDGLVQRHTISADVGAIIKHDIEARREKLK